jgi:ribosomal protein S12 methylthiotransferase accessory factor
MDRQMFAISQMTALNVTNFIHDTALLPAKSNDTGRAVHFRGRVLRAEKNWLDGTHRAVSPQQTLENLRPMMPEAGITRIANITGLDRIGLPVALAIRPNAWSLSVSSGKGLDWPAAAASAAMEAFELYHAETPELPVVNGTCSQLSSDHKLIPVEGLPFRKQSLFHTELPLDWTFGWDLLGQEEVVLPLQMVRLKADRQGRLFNRAAAFPRDTNGLASGNHFLEALCAGIYEVIERDAWACHLYASRSSGHEVPKIDLSSISHPQIRQVLDQLCTAGLHTHLYDCSVDTGVPVYRVVLCDPVELGIPLADGYGAHLDPAIAILRALTEAAQSRTVAISGSRDDMFDIHHGNIGLSAILHQIEQLKAQPARRDLGILVSGAGQTFHEDVHILTSRLQLAGMDQLVVVELAARDNGMSVLKVIVPGLEPCLNHDNAPGSRARTQIGRYV